MNFPRASGILLHITSLPGGFGIGDLGPAAYEICETLASAGQTYWQILPLGPTGYGDSPYQCFSAFAGNILLISPEKLADDALIDASLLSDCADGAADRVDYGAVYEWKRELLPRAYHAFKEGHPSREAVNSFQHENSFWLDDFALYRALKDARDHKAWFEWPDGEKRRDPDALEAARTELADAIDEQKFLQYVFFDQWSKLKEYANSVGLKIIGDIPLFVALDSADVWQHQSSFKLNEDGSPNVVAGVPPDYFSSTGQLWGNPIYDWEAMRSDGFAWWVERIRASLCLFDVLRIDHFRGLLSTWEVPGGDRTAENGEWVAVPAVELFERLRSEFGDIPTIAEDLGFMTPEVEDLRDALGLPGMRILQYGFGGDAQNRDLPHNYTKNCIAYTGTHDNQTAAGWFQSTSDQVREHCLEYLSTAGEEINWELIRSIWASVADTAIVPLQDVLGLGDKAKMNSPGVVGGNWQWRLAPGQFSDEHASRLRRMTEIYGRKI